MEFINKIEKRIPFPEIEEFHSTLQITELAFNNPNLFNMDMVDVQ